MKAAVVIPQTQNIKERSVSLSASFLPATQNMAETESAKN
jgi:hypothetical protein